MDGGTWSEGIGAGAGHCRRHRLTPMPSQIHQRKGHIADCQDQVEDARARRPPRRGRLETPREMMNEDRIPRVINGVSARARRWKERTRQNLLWCVQVWFVNCRAADCAAVRCDTIMLQQFVLAAGGFIMPLRVTFALAASLAIAGSAVAKEAQIGSATLTLPSPPGYCELTDQEPSDARVIKEVGNLVAGAQNELVSMMADCSQLEAWRAAKLPALDDYVQYQTPMGTKDSNLTRAASVKGFCANMRTEGEKRMPGVVSDLNARFEKAYKGAKFNEASFLGVLAEDDDACYYGLLMKLRTEIGDEKTQVTVAATTVVKGKVVYYNLYTAYRDGADTLTAALERHR